jgi:hypothetical protein
MFHVKHALLELRRGTHSAGQQTRASCVYYEDSKAPESQRCWRQQEHHHSREPATRKQWNTASRAVPADNRALGPTPSMPEHRSFNDPVDGRGL